MSMLIKIAWRNIWRQKRRSWITITAMGLGVALSLACMAWIDGTFQNGFDLMVRQTTGHVQLHQHNYPKQHALYDSMPQTLAQQVKKLPALKNSSARAFAYGLLAAGDEAGGAQLIGVNPVDEAATSSVDSKVVQGGRWLDTKSKGEIVLGYGLAKTLKVKVGDPIICVSQAADGSMGNQIFKLVGLVKTGSAGRDRAGAFVRLADLQELMVLPGQIHEISLNAINDKKIPLLVSQVTDLINKNTKFEGSFIVRSWDQINPIAKQMTDFQNAFLFVMLMLVFAVASLGILNTMLMSVFERTREFGVMRAIGVEPRQIVGIVVIESISLALIAAVLGLALGLMMDAYLVYQGVDLSAYMGSFSFGGVNFDPHMYGYVRATPIYATVIGLFVVAVLSALWPAFRAARLKPVEAMREE